MYMYLYLFVWLLTPGGDCLTTPLFLYSSHVAMTGLLCCCSHCSFVARADALTALVTREHLAGSCQHLGE